MALTADALMGKIAQAKEKAKKEEKSSGGNWPLTSFLPEGDHVIRFLHDPKDEIYREVHAYGAGRKALIDPSYLNTEDLPEGFSDRLKEIAQETGKWRLKSRYCFMIYGYLVNTSNPGEYWKPGTLYLIIGDWKLREAFLTAMENYADDIPDQFIMALNPASKGNPFHTKVVKGTGGSVTLTFKYGNKSLVDPVNVEKGYQPLESSYVRPKFYADKWAERVQEYEAELAKYLEYQAQKEAEGGDEDDNNEKSEGESNHQKSEESQKQDKDPESESKSEENSTQGESKTDDEPPFDPDKSEEKSKVNSEEPKAEESKEEKSPGDNEAEDKDPWANF